MSHDPDFDIQLDPLNVAFFESDVSDVSSIAESIDYRLNEPDPAKLAMIESARALLADAEQKLTRYQAKITCGVGKKDGVGSRQRKLVRLTREVQKAEIWLNTLINS
jgi:hypothetical protein